MLQRSVELAAKSCPLAGSKSNSALAPKADSTRKSGMSEMCQFRTLAPQKTRTLPITLSVRASTIGSVESCYSIRIARRFISANFVNDITYPTGDRM